jgi:hypothetical protein
MRKEESTLRHTYPVVPERESGLGPGSAGQSGDTQGMSDNPEADSESVVELLQEGQVREAELVSAIENAPNPDVAEVRTKQFPEDDVPIEYIDQD